MWALIPNNTNNMKVNGYSVASFLVSCISEIMKGEFNSIFTSYHWEATTDMNTDLDSTES